MDVNNDDALALSSQLRQGIVERRPPVLLDGEVECDEVDAVGGYKGHLEAVKKKVGPLEDGG